MNLEGSFLVLVLTLAATFFAILAVQAKALVHSTYWYVVHACCLILIYVTYALFAQNAYLFIWAGLCVVNTWILPFLQGGLKYTAKRIPEEKAISSQATVIFAVVTAASVAAVAFFSSFSLAVASSPIDALGETVCLNLFTALMLFVYGIIVLLTHRHLFKLAIGLLIMTSGAHLTLVQMAPSFFTMVEIEILTKVMGTVFAMLYAARLLAEKYQSADAAELLLEEPGMEPPTAETAGVV
jgi:hydrogenase-4 membrane subunit HyfE